MARRIVSRPLEVAEGRSGADALPREAAVGRLPGSMTGWARRMESRGESRSAGWSAGWARERPSRLGLEAARLESSGELTSALRSGEGATRSGARSKLGWRVVAPPLRRGDDSTRRGDRSSAGARGSG